ncbi:MAG: MlaD family protein [Pirellulales bacterium]
MNDRRMQFAVGAVVLLGVILAVILMMVNSPIPSSLSPFGHKQYQLIIQLEKAPGVGEETPVRKNGVLIGRVASVEDKDEGVEVLANIDDGRTLTNHHVPHVRTTVLGDATIDFEIDPLRRGEPRQTRVDGDTVPGIVDPNPIEAISKLTELQPGIEGAMVALTQAGNSVDALAQQVQVAFGTTSEPGRVKRLMDTTETAMLQFGNAMAAVNQILGDDPLSAGGAVRVPPAPGQQPGQQPPAPGQPTEGELLRRRLRDGLMELPDAIREFRIVLRSADQNLQNLRGFTEPLGRNGPQIAQAILDAVGGIDKLVEEFTVLTNALNSREGTIGQLIHNQQLYENLIRLTGNANVVVLQLHDIANRLRPVLEDARVFMDKIAREPGRVIKGAVGQPSVVK